METSQSIGSIITWRVPTTVPLLQLRDALLAEGFPTEEAGDLSLGQSLSRALREMAKEGRIVRKIPEESSSYQLTREALERGGILEYTKEAHVHIEEGRIVSDSYGIADLATRLAEEHSMKRRTADLTRLVQRLVEHAGGDLVSLRDAGGCYYVPESHAPILERLGRLLGSIGGELRRFPVSVGGRMPAGDVMAEHLTRLIGEFREACATVTQDSRSDVIQRRYARVAELKQKVELYRDLLGTWANGLTKEVDEVCVDLTRRLAESMSTVN